MVNKYTGRRNIKIFKNQKNWHASTVKDAVIVVYRL